MDKCLLPGSLFTHTTMLFPQTLLSIVSHQNLSWLFHVHVNPFLLGPEQQTRRGPSELNLILSLLRVLSK
jgi:hypothetical protein